MEPLYAWHQLAADVALAFGLSEKSELEMATQLNRAIQSGNIRCWRANGEPIRGAINLENMRNPAPLLTVSEGNAWLKKEGYLQEWAPPEKKRTQTGTAKRWTEDAVEPLKKYRKTHNAAETAAHFDISESRMRSILAKEKKKTQTARRETTPFSGLGKR